MFASVIGMAIIVVAWLWQLPIGHVVNVCVYVPVSYRLIATKLTGLADCVGHALPTDAFLTHMATALKVLFGCPLMLASLWNCCKNHVSVMSPRQRGTSSGAYVWSATGHWRDVSVFP